MTLIFNKPVAMRYDYEVRKENELQVLDLRDAKRRMENTEYSERVYYLWFMSLKLLLEMEHLGMGFRKYFGNKIRKELIIGKEVKIDKNFYSDWDLEEVLELPFYKWWKRHKGLFETPQAVDFDNLKSWSDSSNYRFIRVDLRTNYTDIMRGVREGLDDLKNKKLDSKIQFKVYGNPFYDNEIIKYNLLVRKLNEESNFDIFEKEKSRLKITEKKHKQNFEDYTNDGTLIDGSSLWGNYKKFMNLKPEHRTLYVEKHREEDFWEREEGRGSTFIPKSDRNDTVRGFYSNLRNEINRHLVDYQKILNGVAQGVYRKPMKIDF